MEHPKSILTQPRYSTTRVTLYVCRHHSLCTKGIQKKEELKSASSDADGIDSFLEDTSEGSKSNRSNKTMDNGPPGGDDTSDDDDEDWDAQSSADLNLNFTLERAKCFRTG